MLIFPGRPIAHPELWACVAGDADLDIFKPPSCDILFDGKNRPRSGMLLIRGTIPSGLSPAMTSTSSHIPKPRPHIRVRMKDEDEGTFSWGVSKYLANLGATQRNYLGAL
jgi:hypothetical protein